MNRIESRRAGYVIGLLLLPLLLATPTPPPHRRQTPSLPAYPSLFPPAPLAGPIKPRIEVDISLQQLTAYMGATPVRSMPVTTGDWEHPTIIGRFSIQWKREKIDLIGPDYYYHDVPYVMMFARPFYIHAAPWRKEFGVRGSRGCVTLSTEDAKWLYEWTEVGTEVVIKW